MLDLVYLRRDPRGESETYTKWTLVVWSLDMGRQCWNEGVRKDWRCTMWPQWRAVVEPMIRNATTKEQHQ